MLLEKSLKKIVIWSSSQKLFLCFHCFIFQEAPGSLDKLLGFWLSTFDFHNFSRNCFRSMNMFFQIILEMTKQWNSYRVNASSRNCPSDSLRSLLRNLDRTMASPIHNFWPYYEVGKKDKASQIGNFQKKRIGLMTSISSLQTKPIQASYDPHKMNFGSMLTSFSIW